MTAIEGSLPTRRAQSWRRLPPGLALATRRPEQIVFAVPAVIGLVGMVVALLTFFTNSTDDLILLLLVLAGAGMGVAAAVRRSRSHVVDRPVIALAVASLAAAVIGFLLPTWIYGLNINGIISRTVVTGLLLLVIGTGVTSIAISRLLRATPSGQDAALVPVLSVAILIGLIGYALVLGKIMVAGLQSFNVSLLVTPWQQISNPTGFTYTIGFLNNILGTLFLVALTLLFAIFPGVGAGIFMSEYPGRLARVIRFCVTMLRAIAMFIIAATAIGVVTSASGIFDADSFLSQLIRGGFEEGGRVQPEKGSFVLAAVFLALLVLPVIARLTEEGLQSVPKEMREGSVALGATDGYSLRRILLPWAAPNILTALILAGAEAAGGLMIILFIAGPGQHGVGPLNGVTTLDYAVFATHYGPRAYWNSMRDYQFTAALLLLGLTVVLGLIALALRRRFASRYRGSLTAW
jgi:ABC-type phosphate transport system permease subunit